MAALSLFWNTNMASVTSCENALLVILTLHLRLGLCCVEEHCGNVLERVSFSSLVTTNKRSGR